MRPPHLDGVRPLRAGGSMLGSVNWAFVITLLLLLGFIFFWYGASDDRDRLKGERDKLEKAYTEIKVQASAVGEALRDTSLVLGFPTKTYSVGGTSYTASDLDVARRHLSLDGKVDVDENGTKVEKPGMYNMLRNSLRFQISQQARSGENPAATTTEVSFGWATPKFKDKLKQIDALIAAVPPKPSPPVDSGNEAAQAKYRADLEAFTRAVEALKGAMAELETPEFSSELKRYKDTIGMPGAADLDTIKVLEVNFGPKIDVPPTSYAELLTLWHTPFQDLIKELKVNKEADLASIARGQADLKAERTIVADQQKRFTDYKTVAETEAAQKVAELEKERATSATNAQNANTAKNALDTQIAERKKERQELTEKLGALEQWRISNKEKADLDIKRDLVDGRLLSVSNEREVGTISLGSVAKVYPGLKFAVSTVDRGGFRQSKGEVQVISVSGPHSSQVRIVSALSPLSAGDLISNPFFESGREIHIYTVGWTADLIQRRRLAPMNVIIDEKPNGDTDYFVVPDEWVGGADEPPAEGEPAPVGSSPMDKARQEAKVLGATVVTRRMLESFLKL